MDLKSGRDLGSILKELRNGDTIGEYPRERLLDIFIRITNAVAYAHSQGVLHLDL